MRVLIGIQARSASTRLPRKIFEKIGGKEMLLHLYDTAKAVAFMPKLIEYVAAFLIPQGDAELVDFLDAREIPFRAGPEEDVLTRYVQGVEYFRADAVVRLTADCPLLTANVVELCVRHLTEVDYASNVIERTWPDGFDVQGCSQKALGWFDSHQGENREHPFYFFDRNLAVRQTFEEAGLTWRSVVKEWSMLDPRTKVSVDTPADLERVKRIYAKRLAE